MNTRTHRNDAGFSLVELVIVTAVFGIVIGGAIGFMTTQFRSFNKGLDELKTLQNLRYAYQTMSIDLAALGSNVPNNQPMLVYVDEDVIAFSADYTSNLENDFSAVFVNPDAPDGMVQAPRSGVSIPNSSATWPDTTYVTFGGAPSLAELIIHYFEPDTTTAREDDYVLMRQVNDADPEVLSRNLLKQGSQPFFRYFRKRDFEDDEAKLDSIGDNELPLEHVIKIHGSADDTAQSAQIDSIRAVRVSFRASNGRTGEDERFADLSRVVDLPNAGFGILGTCGDEPLVDDDLGATLVTSPDTMVALTWGRSPDEGSGEQDVVRYVIYRRESGDDWGDPFQSIPAGVINYSFNDRSVEPGTVYDYAHAAQDCTPSLSGLSSAQTVSVPTP